MKSRIQHIKAVEGARVAQLQAKTLADRITTAHRAISRAASGRGPGSLTGTDYAKSIYIRCSMG